MSRLLSNVVDPPPTPEEIRFAEEWIEKRRGGGKSRNPMRRENLAIDFVLAELDRYAVPPVLACRYVDLLARQKAAGEKIDFMRMHELGLMLSLNPDFKVPRRDAPVLAEMQRRKREVEKEAAGRDGEKELAEGVG